MIDYRETRRSAALARLCRFDVLSVDEEQRLFGRLKAVRAKALRPHGRAATEAACRRAATEIRNRIVESNLRLVVSLAKHFAAPERSLEDLVSEASLPLIRCVESFDAQRGTRFSTYATRALTNFFGKLRRQDHHRRARLVTGIRAKYAALPGDTSTADGLVAAEDLRQLRERLALLPSRERILVTERFGLTGDRRPRTFRELGVKHGLSKERVRVLTSEAIARLRESFDESQTP
jgi:RNA polymerase sigma factor (sigma-70 family)